MCFFLVLPAGREQCQSQRCVGEEVRGCPMSCTNKHLYKVSASTPQERTLTYEKVR